jgi:hypothetical protein
VFECDRLFTQSSLILEKIEPQGDLGLSLVEPANLLEKPLNDPLVKFEKHKFTVSPWKIVSFKVKSQNLDL